MIAGYAERGMLGVWVNAFTLQRIAKISAFKDYAIEEDKDLLALYLKAIGSLPKENAQAVLLRYFKLATFEVNQKHKNSPQFNLRYSAKSASLKLVAETMGISIHKLNYLLDEAYQLMAEYIMDETVKERKGKAIYANRRVGFVDAVTGEPIKVK